jgi:hypothetical protein
VLGVGRGDSSLGHRARPGGGHRPLHGAAPALPAVRGRRHGRVPE